MKMLRKKTVGQRRVYDIEVEDVHNFYANGINVHNCATAGGVSVIKDDGTVVDSAVTVSQVDIAFDPSGRLYFVQETSGDRVYSVSDYASDGFTEDATYYVNTYTKRKPDLLSVSGVSAFEFEDANNGGLVRVAEDPSDFARYMHSHTTSTYSTGWMNGDIKGAFLSDTDDTDLVGSGELVTNGTFDTDTSGWAADADGSIAWDAGTIKYTGASVGPTFMDVSQNITTVAGQRYCLSFEVTALSPTNEIRCNVTGTSNVASVSGTGVAVGYFTATQANTLVQIGIVGGLAGETFNIDNISVKLADADRSVNNNGLIVNGTVTRTAVATGADLVAYSGFSASNYLEQPYNSDLDFGTGDFCVMGWVSLNAAVNDSIVARKSATPNRFKIDTDLGKIRCLAGSNTTSSIVLPANTFSQFAVVRASGVVSIYINGALDVSVADTGDVDSGLPLYVGINETLGQELAGSLALLRISATAPTAEQIAKIYEDEKVLFQENAQATLYGASDAVTALAHDSDTGLLHVGTSAGRSVFQGLRRVSNTTTAVGTAISASNNLIVEE